MVLTWTPTLNRDRSSNSQIFSTVPPAICFKDFHSAWVKVFRHLGTCHLVFCPNLPLSRRYLPSPPITGDAGRWSYLTWLPHKRVFQWLRGIVSVRATSIHNMHSFALLNVHADLCVCSCSEPLTVCLARELIVSSSLCGIGPTQESRNRRALVPFAICLPLDCRGF